MQACFGAGTPIVVDHEGGSWPIEDLRVGDFILTRDEYNSTRALVLRRVEGIFARLGRVLHLHLGQQTIRTTAEHPFWVVNQNTWLPAGSLHQGDILLSHTGQQVAVEEVYDTGEWETVYNLRVEDYHTYFVGGADWGFSVWAHNASAACHGNAPKNAKGILDQLPGKTGKTGPIKKVPNEQALKDLFDTLGKEGKTVNPGTYPGVVKELPDGTIVRMRPCSKSGGATLDITMPDGKIYKVHIQ